MLKLILSLCLTGYGICAMRGHTKLDYELKLDPRSVDYWDYLLSGFVAVIPTMIGIIGTILSVVCLIW